MDKFEKAQKNLKGDMIFLAIAEIVILIIVLINLGDYYQKELIYKSIASIISIVFMIYCYNLADSKSKSAGYLSIVIAVIMKITLDIINVILGIFLLIHSSMYIKNYNLKG